MGREKILNVLLLLTILSGVLFGAGCSIGRIDASQASNSRQVGHQSPKGLPAVHANCAAALSACWEKDREACLDFDYFDEQHPNVCTLREHDMFTAPHRQAYPGVSASASL